MKDTGGCDSGFRYYDDSWKSCFSDKLFALVEYIAIFLSVARGPAPASAVSLQRGELLIVSPKGRKDRRVPVGEAARQYTEAYRRLVHPGACPNHQYQALHPPGPEGSEGSGAPIASARKAENINSCQQSAISFRRR